MISTYSVKIKRVYGWISAVTAVGFFLGFLVLFGLCVWVLIDGVEVDGYVVSLTSRNVAMIRADSEQWEGLFELATLGTKPKLGDTIPVLFHPELSQWLGVVARQDIWKILMATLLSSFIAPVGWLIAFSTGQFGDLEERQPARFRRTGDEIQRGIHRNQ